MFWQYLFYIWAFLAILFEVCKLSPKGWREYMSQMKYLKDKKKDYSTTEAVFILLQVLYFLWIFVGFFSSQWILFGSIFLLSFIPKKIYIINFIDSVLTIGILLFMIVNKFHLHLDLNPFN